MRPLPRSMTRRHVLTASVGLASALRRPSWEGRVNAVFRTSLQLIGLEDTLLHLHSGPLLVSPFSLRITGSPAEWGQEVRGVMGLPVLKRGSDLDIGGRVSLSLASMRYYQSPALLTQPLDPAGVSLASRILRHSGRASGLVLIPGAGEMLARLPRALATNDAEQVLAISQQIIGFGPGLTPSGDDVLVGCLRGLWLLVGGDQRFHVAIDSLRQGLLPTLQARTTRVGAAFIHHALYGQFAEVLDRAAMTLVAPADPQEVSSSMTNLLAQGETSGTDTAMGLLLCLEAVLNGRCGTFPEIPSRVPVA